MTAPQNETPLKRATRWLAHEPFEGTQRWHFVVFAIFCAPLFFFFQHPDIGHTGGASFVWLEGRVFHFYERCQATAGLHNYLPSTTWVFAIWNIPLRLLGYQPDTYRDLTLLWFKLLPTLVAIGCIPLLRGIGQRLGLAPKESARLAWIWITSPILVFSQLLFGQYDIFTVFVVLVALRLYLDDRLLGFVVACGVAFTFKYYAVVVFGPLLLLKEKRPARVLALAALFLVPAVLETLPYLRSPAFKEGVLGFGAVTRSSESVAALGNVSVSPFALAWMVLCGFAYYLRPENKADLAAWITYLPVAATGAFFSLLIWHPQWVLLITPFLALSAVIHPRTRYFLLLDLAQAFGFLGFTVNHFPNNVDVNLVLWGVLGPFLRGYEVMADHAPGLRFFPGGQWFYFSVFVACCVLQVVLARPVARPGQPVAAQPDDKEGPIALRTYLPIGFFILVTVLCFVLPRTDVALLSVQKLDAPDAPALVEFAGVSPSSDARLAVTADSLEIETTGADPFVAAEGGPPCPPHRRLCVIEIELKLSTADDVQVFVAGDGAQFSEAQSARTELTADSYYRLRVAVPRYLRSIALRVDTGTRPGVRATINRMLLLR